MLNKKDKHKLPTLKNCVQIRHLFDGVEIAVVEGSEKIGFIRRDNRWRFARGPYCSIHHVASSIFDYQPEPCHQSIEFMVTCLECFCELADSFWESANEQYILKPKIKVMDDVQNRFEQQSSIDKKNDFLYLMKHTNGLVKIGRSSNPRLREKTLQAEDPRLNLLAQFKECGKYEKRMHAIFSDLRIRGEWFQLSDHHIEWVHFVLSYKCRN